MADTELDPDTVTPPKGISASPAGAQAGAGLRDVLLILSVIPTLIAVLGTRDVFKIVAYISSAEFVPVLGLIVGAATLAWRQWLTRRQHATTVVAAISPANTNVTVKGL